MDYSAGDRVEVMARTGEDEDSRRGTIAHVGRTLYIIDLDNGQRVLMAPWTVLGGLK